MQTVGWLLYMLLQIYIWVLLARMIISWIPMIAPRWRPRGILASLFEVVYTLTDPPIRAFRKLIPPLNLGGVSLDIAFMAVLIVIFVLQRVILGVFF
ncbi:YggT family protein [Brooklawnia sp.]|uniref:YggT family protein n=1 Tax=Brooklawnia sp. TaxID=2699740 RepID=UPI00312007D9